MSSTVSKTRRNWHRRTLFGTLAAIIVLALSFCGWVYRAKTQRDLNMKLLGAVRNDDTETARVLLMQGADPNIRDVPEEQLSLWQQIRRAFHKKSQLTADQPDTVLEMAVSFRDENIPLVKALLDAGARPDDCTASSTPSYSHITPLMDGISSGRVQTVQTLLDHGANIRARDDSGAIPLNRRQWDRHGEPVAAQIKIVKLLVNAGSDVDTVDNAGRTPLMNVIGESTPPEVAQFLVERGAKVDARSVDGSSALTSAAAYGNEGIVQFLLAHGAEIDPIDVDGNTPLIMAFECFHRPWEFSLPNLVKVLVLHGTDVNHRNKAGVTPLSIAREHEWTETVQLLKAAGAKR